MATGSEAAYTPEESELGAKGSRRPFGLSLSPNSRPPDEYVFGVPMHISAPFHLETLDRSGRPCRRTFSYGPSGPAGLLKDKKATFLVSSGGVYSKGSPAASYDFVEPYLARSLVSSASATPISLLPAALRRDVRQSRSRHLSQTF